MAILPSDVRSSLCSNRPTLVLFYHRQTSASQQRWPGGKRNGERKGWLFCPQTLGTICVQTDLYLYCLKGSLEET